MENNIIQLGNRQPSYVDAVLKSTLTKNVIAGMIVSCELSAALTWQGWNKNLCVACKSKHDAKHPSTSGPSAGQQVQYLESTTGVCSTIGMLQPSSTPNPLPPAGLARIPSLAPSYHHRAPSCSGRCSAHCPCLLPASLWSIT